MTFRNYKRLGLKDNHLRHSMEVITDEIIDITDNNAIKELAMLASDRSPYHHLGYNMYKPSVVRYVSRGYYVITWESNISCD